MREGLLLKSQEGREFHIAPFGLFFIGRDKASQISFPADKKLSARHAVIFNNEIGRAHV